MDTTVKVVSIHLVAAIVAAGFSAWLWDGILPFAFCWFILWTILFNYL